MNIFKRFRIGKCGECDKWMFLHNKTISGCITPNEEFKSKYFCNECSNEMLHKLLKGEKLEFIKNKDNEWKKYEN